VKPDEILQPFVISPSANASNSCACADAKPVSAYAPIAKYVLDLKNGAKPESAAEDLLRRFAKTFGLSADRTSRVAEGVVDFMLPERMGESMQLELKPLFLREGRMRSGAAMRTENHVARSKNIFRDHEYLTLTDLRTAWFSVRAIST